MHPDGNNGKASGHQGAYGKSADRCIWKERHAMFFLVITGLVPVDLTRRGLRHRALVR